MLKIMVEQPKFIKYCLPLAKPVTLDLTANEAQSEEDKSVEEIFQSLINALEQKTMDEVNTLLENGADPSSLLDFVKDDNNILEYLIQKAVIDLPKKLEYLLALGSYTMRYSLLVQLCQMIASVEPSNPNNTLQSFNAIVNTATSQGAQFQDVIQFRDGEGDNILGRFIRYLTPEQSPEEVSSKFDILFSLPGIEALINTCNKHGYNPLSVALCFKKYTAIKPLLQRGADYKTLLNFRDTLGNTILSVLCYFSQGKYSQFKLIKYLLAIKEFQSLIQIYPDSGHNAIQIAALNGQLDIIKLFMAYSDRKYCLQSLAKIRDAAENSILHLSVIRKQRDLLNFLLAQPEFRILFDHQNAEHLTAKALMKRDASTPQLPSKKHSAALTSHPQQSRLLFSLGTDGTTIPPLVKACLAYQLETIEALLRSKHDSPTLKQDFQTLLDFIDQNLNNILHLLIEQDKEEREITFFKRLLFRFSKCKKLLTFFNKNYQTPISLAIAQDRVSYTAYLLRLPNIKLDFLKRIEHGYQRCMLDAILFEGSFEMIKLVYDLGYFHEDKIKQKPGYSLSTIVIMRGDQKIADLFKSSIPKSIASYAAQVIKHPNTALHEAAIIGYKLGLENLLKIPEYKAMINAPNSFGNTPIMLAAYKGLREIVAFLEEQGATPLKDLSKMIIPSDGSNFLQKTVEYGSETGILYLLSYPEFRALINAPDRDGRGSLYFAAETDSTDHFRILLNHGANIYQFLNYQFSSTPISESDYSEDMKIVINAALRLFKFASLPALQLNTEEFKKCLEDGASLLQRDDKGNTPLHMAAESGSYVFIRFVAEYDLTILKTVNNDLETAFDIIKKRASKNQSEMLAEIGICLAKQSMIQYHENTSIIMRLIDSDLVKASEYLSISLKAIEGIADLKLQNEYLSYLLDFIIKTPEVRQSFNWNKLIELLKRACNIEKPEDHSIFCTFQAALAMIYLWLYDGKIELQQSLEKPKSSQKSLALSLDDSESTMQVEGDLERTEIDPNKYLELAFLYSHKVHFKNDDLLLRREIVSRIEGQLFKNQFGDLRTGKACLALIQKRKSNGADIRLETEFLKNETQKLEKECARIEDSMQLNLSKNVKASTGKRKRSAEGEGTVSIEESVSVKDDKQKEKLDEENTKKHQRFA